MMRISRLHVWSTMISQVADGVNRVPHIPVTFPLLSRRHRLPIPTVRKIIGELEQAGLVSVDDVPPPKTIRITPFGTSVLQMFIASEFLNDSLTAQAKRRNAQKFRLHNE